MKPARRSPLEIVFAVLLRLYPRDFRRAYGKPMCQAFRDQCRELTGAGSSLKRWQLLARTLADAAVSLPREHQAAAWQHGQAMPWLLAATFMLALGTLFFHQRLVLLASDGLSHAARYSLTEWRTDATWEAYSSHRARALAAMLADESVEKRLVAVALSADRWIESDVPGAEAVREALRAEIDPARITDVGILRLLAWGCHATGACDASTAIARLQRLDADNAAVWMLAATRASQLGNEPAQLEALERALDAHNYATPHAKSAALWLEASNVDRFRKPFWGLPADGVRSFEYSSGLIALRSEWRGCGWEHNEGDVGVLCEANARKWRQQVDTRMAELAVVRILAYVDDVPFQEAVRSTWEAMQAQRERIDAAPSAQFVIERLAVVGDRGL